MKEQYQKEVIPALMKKFNYKSVMEVPKLEKIVLNVGLGDIRENPKALENTINDLSIITGQKPVVTKARKSIAAFKIREGVNVGCKVTLRSEKMYEFADVVRQAGMDYSPSAIANYVYDLVKEYNQFYHDFSILKEENEQLRSFRLLLSKNVAKVVKLAMSLLGIEVPERM